MRISIKFFASLREQLKMEDMDISVESVTTVHDLWQHVVKKEIPDNIMVAINQEYASMQSLVQDGDEIAFFPPVTGG